VTTTSIAQTNVSPNGFVPKKSPNDQILVNEISRQPHLIQAAASAVVAAFSPWACLRDNCSEW